MNQPAIKTEVGAVKPTAAEMKNLADLWHVKKAASDAYGDAAKALGAKYAETKPHVDEKQHKLEAGALAKVLKEVTAATEQDKLAKYHAEIDCRQMVLEL